MAETTQDAALVERLARWLHDTAGRVGERQALGGWTSWRKMNESYRNTYRGLARELLTAAPAWLRAALAAKGEVS